VVFCGDLNDDLNDEPDAATTQIVAGPSGSEIDRTPGSAFDRPDHDDVFRLWNLAPLLPADQRFTRVFKGRPELIDHIFATRRLVNPDNLPAVQTIRSPEALPSIGDDPNTAATSLALTTPRWLPPSTSDRVLRHRSGLRRQIRRRLRPVGPVGSGRRHPRPARRIPPRCMLPAGPYRTS
jgi:hypothetical protein